MHNPDPVQAEPNRFCAAHLIGHLGLGIPRLPSYTTAHRLVRNDNLVAETPVRPTVPFRDRVNQHLDLCPRVFSNTSAYPNARSQVQICAAGAYFGCILRFHITGVYYRCSSLEEFEPSAELVRDRPGKGQLQQRLCDRRSVEDHKER
jgi:hypothetical protein